MYAVQGHGMMHWLCMAADNADAAAATAHDDGHDNQCHASTNDAVALPSNIQC
jgi:hypothetical protein